MLVLGRKKQESIHIGNDIVVSIEDIANGMVKIGIDAPKDVVILRSELKEKIASQNKKASIQIDNSLLKDFSKKLQK
jgi:carbon storage regulator